MLAKLYKHYENIPEADRIERMKRDGARILPSLSNINGNGVRELIIFIFAACDMGEISSDDYSLLCKTVGELPDYESALRIFTAAENAETDEIGDAVETVSLLDDETKSSLISFLLCF